MEWMLYSSLIALFLGAVFIAIGWRMKSNGD